MPLLETIPLAKNDEISTQLAAIKEMTERILKTREATVKFLQDAGIIRIIDNKIVAGSNKIK